MPRVEERRGPGGKEKVAMLWQPVWHGKGDYFSN